jgi:hypothetical protein
MLRSPKESSNPCFLRRALAPNEIRDRFYK